MEPGDFCWKKMYVYSKMKIQKRNCGADQNISEGFICRREVAIGRRIDSCYRQKGFKNSNSSQIWQLFTIFV